MDNELLDAYCALLAMQELERWTVNGVIVGISNTYKGNTCQNNACGSFTSLSDMDAHSILVPSLPLAAQIQQESFHTAPVSVPLATQAVDLSTPLNPTPPTQNITPGSLSLPPSGSLLSAPSTQSFQLPPPTHADRNNLKFVQTSRQLSKTSDTQKAAQKIRQDAVEVEQKALNTDLTALLANHRLELKMLAARHAKKIEYIDKLIGTSKHYKAKRGVNIENAKLHAKAMEINAGQLSYYSHYTFWDFMLLPYRSFCWRPH